MSLERELSNIGRMPVDVYEQLEKLPPPEKQERICEQIFDKVIGILNYHGVVFYQELSSCRVKSKERIQEKIKIRGSDAPVRDIYGTRVIVGDTDRYRLNDLIRFAFPLTPEFFSDGRPSVRDYSNSKVREDSQKNFNIHISNEFSALHINVVFLREGSSIYDIGEIQIMTKDELDSYNKTREDYVNGRAQAHSKP